VVTDRALRKPGAGLVSLISAVDSSTQRDGQLGVDDPLEVELDRLGVERRPVVERRALDQAEGDGQPVLRGLERLGEPGPDGALVVDGDQRLDHVVDHVLHGRRGLAGGVEGVRVDADGDGEGAPAVLIAGRGRLGVADAAGADQQGERRRGGERPGPGGATACCRGVHGAPASTVWLGRWDTELDGVVLDGRLRRSPA
jgi:hypothetical protein